MFRTHRIITQIGFYYFHGPPLDGFDSGGLDLLFLRYMSYTFLL